MDVNNFVNMPFNKQLHTCCMLWLRVNRITLYPNGKLTPKYFQIRGYLWKLPRQDIKNIALMLDEADEPVPMYGLYKKAIAWVAKKQSEAAVEQAKDVTDKKEYDLDLMGFLDS